MGGQTNIEAICSPADIPKMVAVANITGVDLSAEEGFLLSRIDGHTPVSMVLQLSTFDDVKTLELLLGLYNKGLINFAKVDGQTWEEFRAKKSKANGSDGLDHGKSASSAPDDEDAVSLADLVEEETIEEVPDLPKSVCLEIIRLHRRMTEATNPYDILAVPRDVDNRKLKIVHRDIAKNYHPDRYFRKEIGGYRDMIAMIFAVAHEAYEILSDPSRRQKLDAELKLEEYKKARDEAKKREKEGRAAPKKKAGESIWAKKLKQGLKERIVKARRHAKMAKDAFEAGNFVAASSNIRLAMTYDPWNEEYPKYYEEIKPIVSEAIYKESMKRGRSHEAMVDYGLARQEFERAIDARPDDPDASYHLGLCLLRLEHDVRRAKDLLQVASRDRPDDIEVLLKLGEAYAKLKMYKNALRTYEKIKKLDRKNEVAVAEIKRLKKLA